MGGSSSGSEPKPDPVLDEINLMTLERLKKEEADLAKEERERQSILAAGRIGRTSLLSSGFGGFSKGESVQASAQKRANEQSSGKRRSGRRSIIKKTTTPKKPKSRFENAWKVHGAQRDI